MTSVSKWKVCYSESSDDIRSQYTNRPSSPTAGILSTLLMKLHDIRYKMTHVSSLTCNSHVNYVTLLLFKSYCADTKLYLILVYRHAYCFKSIYQIAANSKYAFKQYTSLKWQLYMLLTSNVLLLNVALSLDDRLLKYHRVRVLYTTSF